MQRGRACVAWLRTCSPGLRRLGMIHSRLRIELVVTLFVLVLPACNRQPSPSTQKEPKAAAPEVSVTADAQGPIVIRTKSSEFDVLPSGYVQAFLVKDGK